MHTVEWKSTLGSGGKKAQGDVVQWVQTPGQRQYDAIVFNYEARKFEQVPMAALTIVAYAVTPGMEPFDDRKS